MVAVSRFVEFDVDTVTSFTADSSAVGAGGGPAVGTPGYVETGNAANTSDTITIVQGVSDQLQVSVDGGGFEQITLTAGTDLDSRMVAREIGFKLKQLVGAEFEHVLCTYVNNKFRIYSSSLGASSQVAVDNGANDCLHLLGMASSQGGALSVNSVGGSDNKSSTYTGNATVSGVYKGQFDDIYTIFIGTTHPISGVNPDGGNIYAGTATAAGDWNESVSETYTITISTASGSVLNAGTGNVPTMTWTSDQSDNNASPVEILYSDYYYEIGSKGARIKFSDAPFGNGDEFQLVCTSIANSAPAETSSSVGTARYHWSSLREGKSSSSTVTSAVGTAVGTKGLTIAFSASGQLQRRDEFRILASGPQPQGLGITTLNYGNVTVSTYSPTKAFWFELISGATIMQNVKFGLQSHGTAAHHNEGNSDTLFAFGTAGEGDPASDGTEWRASVDAASDLASDVAPSYLSATKENLDEVSTADASEDIANNSGELVSDFIWTAIKLGVSETGSNLVTYRVYYDYA